MIKMDKIRKYMIVGLTVLSLAAVTACGAKKILQVIMQSEI